MSYTITNNVMYVRDDAGNLVPVSMIASGADQTIQAIKDAATAAESQIDTKVNDANTAIEAKTDEQVARIPEVTALAKDVNALEGKKLDKTPGTWPAWTTDEKAQARGNIDAADAESVDALKGDLADVSEVVDAKFQCGINAFNSNAYIGKKYGDLLASGSATLQIPIDWDVIPDDYNVITVVLGLNNSLSDHMYFGYVTNGVRSVDAACGKSNGNYTRGETESVILSTNPTYYSMHKDDVITALQFVSGDYATNTNTFLYNVNIVDSAVIRNTKRIEELAEEISDLKVGKYLCGINCVNTNGIVGKKYGEIFISSNSTFDIPIDWSVIPDWKEPKSLILALNGTNSNHMYFSYMTNGVRSVEAACGKNNGNYTRGVSNAIRVNTNSTYYSMHKDDIITALYFADSTYSEDSTNYVFNTKYTLHNEEKKIMCWGDSRTAQEWQRTLLDNIHDKDWVLYHGGVGGQTTTEIATRQGGVPLMVDEFTIPSDTTDVAVNIYGWHEGKKELNLLVNLGNRQLNPVTINGVKGNLSKNGSTYYFTRLESGTSVSVDDFTRVYTYGCVTFDESFVTIIFSGANDHMTEEEIPDWISVQKSMVEKLGKNARYIIISEYFHQDSLLIPKMVSAQSRAFGYHLCDLRNYSLLYGLKKAGITPTAQDETDIANGVIPTSLRSDQVHQNEKWKIVTAWLVYQKGKELGYWS